MTNENKNYLQKQNLNEVTENEEVQQPPCFPTMMDEVGYDKLESIKRQKEGIAQQFLGEFQHPIAYPNLTEPKIQETQFQKDQTALRFKQKIKSDDHKRKLLNNQAVFNKSQVNKTFSPPSLPQPPSFEEEKSKILRKSDSIEQKFSDIQQKINEAENDFGNLDW